LSFLQTRQRLSATKMVLSSSPLFVSLFANLNENTANLMAFELADNRKKVLHLRANPKTEPETTRTTGARTTRKAKAKIVPSGSAAFTPPAGTSSSTSLDSAPTADFPGKARHCTDKYLLTTGDWGDLHYVIAWHATGHQLCSAFSPSRELVGHRSNIEINRRYEYIASLAALHLRLNHLLSLIHPHFSNLLIRARPLLLRHPTIKTLLAIWLSHFFGHAVLMNKQSGRHLDKAGVRHGGDMLVASGDFSGADLYLHDANIRTSFMAGDVFFFDGTVQRHEIMDFRGPQRMSHVFFVHQSVFKELGMEQDTDKLRDPTIDLVQQQLDAKPVRRVQRGQPSKKPSRSSRGGQKNHRAKPY